MSLRTDCQKSKGLLKVYQKSKLNYSNSLPQISMEPIFIGSESGTNLKSNCLPALKVIHLQKIS